MVGSFIIFLISLILHIVFLSLESTFTVLSDITVWTQWIVIGTAVIFGLFTLVTLFKK